jgi:mRNA interferase RelE/StbE
VSRFTVYVTPRAWDEIKDLPGHIRSRVRQAINAFASEPRPPQSIKLDVPDSDYELRRLRLDRWRIVYAIGEADSTVDVLAVLRGLRRVAGRGIGL